MHVTLIKKGEGEEKRIVKLLRVLVMSMACLNMYNNNDQQGYCSVMGPRISFSNDFADAKQVSPKINCYTEAPVSSDFEFSLPANSVNLTDELSLKGKTSPSKVNCNSIPKTVTLRDELLVEDDDEEFPRLSKNLGWWRIDKLGLKRNHNHNHIVAKKGENGGLERIDEVKDD